MGNIFRPRDFADGSAPGSDPYDNPYPQYRKPAPWASPGAKAEGANAVAAFLLDPNRETFAVATEGLSAITGWGNVGTYQSFDDPVKLAALVSYLIQRPGHDWHDLARPRLWCDVEERVRDWLDSSGTGARIEAAAAAHTEARERKQLRTLLARYPDEVAAP